MIRLILFIIIHCSAVRTYQTSSAEQIDQWHRNRGWQCIGYHYVVRRDGTIESGRPESMIGAHCLHYNRHSIGICYEGGLDAQGNPRDTRTPAQKRALKALIQELKIRYPHASITSHHTFNPHKACPCFDADHEYLHL